MHVLGRMGIHATTDCSAGWGRVARHDLLATIFLIWLASSAGLSSQSEYFKGEAKGLLFGTASRPADALVFPPLQAPGQALELPTAIEFRVSGAFSTASVTSRKAARRDATSAQAIVQAATLVKQREYRRKLATAWDVANPGTPLPGSHPHSPIPAGGLD